MNYTDLLSTPDTTNDREPQFPGIPNTGSQHSDRYIAQRQLALDARPATSSTSSRSAAAVARRCSRRRSAPAQFGGHLDRVIRAATSSTSTTWGSATLRRPAPTAPVRQRPRILENTLSWLKGSHNIQAGFAFTQADVWLENQQYVPTINFGIELQRSGRVRCSTPRTSPARRARATQQTPVSSTQC